MEKVADDFVVKVQNRVKEAVENEVYQPPEHIVDAFNPFKRTKHEEWEVEPIVQNPFISDKKLKEAQAVAWGEDRFITPGKQKRENPVISPYDTNRNTNFHFRNAVGNSKAIVSKKKKYRGKKKNYKAR